MWRRQLGFFVLVSLLLLLLCSRQACADVYLTDEEVTAVQSSLDLAEKSLAESEKKLENVLTIQEQQEKLFGKQEEFWKEQLKEAKKKNFKDVLFTFLAAFSVFEILDRIYD